MLMNLQVNHHSTLMKRFLIIIIQFHQVLSSFSSSSSISITNPNHPCPHQQRLILLQFKQMFAIADESLCGYYHDKPSYPKTLSWNESSTDCCSWDGVTCDDLTGDVIGIDLTCSQLSGTFHPNTTLFQLPLTSLNLSFNNFQQSHIPSSIGMLAPTLTHLNISNSSFTGPIPSEIAHLSKLVVLRLRDDYEDTPLLFRLEQHDFQNIISNLTQLEILHLHRINMSSSIIPDSIGHLRSLNYLTIYDCNLSGPLPGSIGNLSQLIGLSLSYNNFIGLIPRSLSNLNELEYLLLSENQFEGSIPAGLFGLPYLDAISLDNNMISGALPFIFFNNHSMLSYLSISTNHLSGPIPVGLFGLPNLNYLSLDNNMLSGVLPSMFFNNKSMLFYLSISRNNLSGPIPQSISNLTNLFILDLQNNNFSGGIPATFAKNNFLSVLALNGNGLEGPIPESLSLCKSLKLIDVGNNMINGTFPIWMDALPELEVLVLRSNKFHGFLEISNTSSPFPRLRIFDISHNEFSGPLPSYYFNNFNAMKKVNQKSKNLESLTADYRVYVTMTMKGSDASIEGVILAFRTIIDLSSNKFVGAVPDVAGNLFGLTLLNMSNNRLTGHIPVKLGNLVQLEQLDLSSNQLTGEIPQELTSLTFLEVLNLSCNGLEGHIPQGRQFDTFSNTSYMENMALCGLPLSRKCQGYEDDSEDDSDYAFMNGFTWQAVLMGYASGMIIGLGGGCLSFYTGKPKWFATMIDEEGSKIIKKYRRTGNLRLH